jgi:hypothetical protein
MTSEQFLQFQPQCPQIPFTADCNTQLSQMNNVIARKQFDQVNQVQQYTYTEAPRIPMAQDDTQRVLVIARPPGNNAGNVTISATVSQYYYVWNPNSVGKSLDSRSNIGNRQERRFYGGLYYGARYLLVHQYMTATQYPITQGYNLQYYVMVGE